MTPRAVTIGSILRPAELIEAARAHHPGTLSREELGAQYERTPPETASAKVRARIEGMRLASEEFGA